MKLLRLYENIGTETGAEACVAQFSDQLPDDGSGVIRPQFIKVMKSFKSCIANYNEAIYPEGKAYRPHQMTMQELLNQYEDISDDLKDGGEFNFTFRVPFKIQGWFSDKSTAESLGTTSPFLTSIINQYNNLKDDQRALNSFILDISTQLGDVTVPVTVELLSSSDDFLLKGNMLPNLKHNDLIRVNNQPTRVKGYILGDIFENIYNILRELNKV
tara:strand:- start:205 stop:849 length:645 start_codon:yes stop_codon:yes gene_type:complete